MKGIPWILLITINVATMISAKDSKFQFGVITHNSAEVFVTPFCGEGIVEYRNCNTGKTGRLQITKPPYATKITGLQPATKYQIRKVLSHHNEDLTKHQRDKWKVKDTFETDHFSVFGRVTLKLHKNINYAPRNSRVWNESLELITTSYSKLGLPYKDLEIIRILNDRVEKPVVHYRFKVNNLSNLTRYQLSGQNFRDSMVQSGGVPNGSAYVVKRGNKVILFYWSDTKCFSLIERYMSVSRDSGTTTEIHLNVADSTATSPAEEDGLVITSEGDLIRDDGRSVGRLEPDTLVMLTPRFLILDCLKNMTLPIYSEVYGGIDYVTERPADIIYKYIDPDNITVPTMELNIERERNRTVVYIPPVQNAVEYKILSDGQVVSHVQGVDVKCAQYTTAILQGLPDTKSYTISLIAVVKDKMGKHVSVTLKQDLLIKAVECSMPSLPANLKLDGSNKSERKIYFRCSNGTKLRGRRYAVCRQNGWTKFPTCKEECGLPRLPSNLRLTNSSRMRILYFKCSRGTQLRGRNYAVCNRNDRWTTFPTCEEISRPCRVLLVRNSLTPRRNRFIFAKGETVRYTCREGYVLRGHNDLTCIGIRWNKPRPSCIRVTCRVPYLNSHSTRQGRKQVYHVGGGIVFSCDKGYRMEGNPTSKCMSDGSWSSKPPNCLRKKIYCNIPYRLRQFSVISPAKEYYNESEIIHYNCEQGYTPYSSTTSTCLPNGQWSPKLPQCQKFTVKCTDSSLQGRWIRPERYFPVGYRIVFRCPRGYRIYGSYTTFCLPNGRWSFSKPVCYFDRRLFNAFFRSYTERWTRT